MKQVIARWIGDGGILVAIGLAANWAESICFEILVENCVAPAEQETPVQPATPRTYADFAADQADQVIGGAIVASILDLSHPLAFGYTTWIYHCFDGALPCSNPATIPTRHPCAMPASR